MSKSKSATEVVEQEVSGNGKSIEKVQATSIDDVKKVLDEQILRFNRMTELIQNRERFAQTRLELTNYLSEQGADFDDSLDSPHLRIQISDNRKYRGDSQISIANNLMVREFIEFSIRKIDAKVLEIEKEILG